MAEGATIAYLPPGVMNTNSEKVAASWSSDLMSESTAQFQGGSYGYPQQSLSENRTLGK